MENRQATGLEQYDIGVTMHRHSPYMDFPAHVHMETYSQCNAACYFCPYPTLDRQGVKMSDDLIAKIINDLTDIPKTLPFQLSPFKVNEPFLDVRLFDILAMVNEKLPQASLALTSNSTPITEKALDRLAKVKNLGYLWISLNDYRPDEYEKTMQLPFARTLERLKLIHKFKQEGKLPIQVVLSRVGDGTVEDNNFKIWVMENFPAFSASVFQRGGWIGQVDIEIGEVPNVGCIRWFDLSITSTGIVAHCCMDGKAKYPVGDVSKQHLLEIYNAQHYRSLRERTVSRRHVEPCNKCTFL
jgi:MoaA/NifB/PqqE/SkfB family radical SAM enzyme